MGSQNHRIPYALYREFRKMPKGQGKTALLRFLNLPENARVELLEYDAEIPGQTALNPQGPVVRVTHDKIGDSQ